MEDENVVNRFVKQLMSIIDEAATHVHQTNIRIRPPKRYPTPYGGRLMWTLPGKTKILAHLKDKCKIRTRKRWSQVGSSGSQSSFPLEEHFLKSCLYILNRFR